ncbi:MAG: hypothetical protein M1830_000478 [Pleopsidium flavum]|nr:MAG: hypothetical protein M1830_000478 [Pleopsidium flavum]
MAPTDKQDPAPGAMSASDAAFLTTCLRNTEGTVVVKIDAVAEACGHQNPKSAVNKLSLLKKKFNLQIVTTGGSSPKKTLDATAIASGGPATPASDKVTKHATPSAKKGVTRVLREVRMRKRGGDSGDGSTKKPDIEEDPGYWESTTEEDEPIPTDENGKIFPKLDIGARVTRSGSLSPKKAESIGMAKKDMAVAVAVAEADDEEAETLAAAKALLLAAKGTV